MNIALIRFFSPQQLASNDKYYSVAFTDEGVFEGGLRNFRSSYYVLGARLLGLTYPDFLVYCLQNFKSVRLFGKKGYCYAAFKDISECQKLCNILEKELKELLQDCDMLS